MFRANLSRGRLWVTLGEEVKIVQSYLELQKRRMGGMFIYEVDIEDWIMDAYVMKMILQPLVENSLQHGFSAESAQNRIVIHAWRAGEDLCIDVKDNGAGTDVETLNKLLSGIEESKDSFALRNIHERIVTRFGHPYGLTALNQPEAEGTVIRLVLPFIQNEPEDHFMEGEKKR